MAAKTVQWGLEKSLRLWILCCRSASIHSTTDCRQMQGSPHNRSNQEYLTTAITYSSLLGQHGDAARQSVLICRIRIDVQNYTFTVHQCKFCAKRHFESGKNHTKVTLMGRSSIFGVFCSAYVLFRCLSRPTLSLSVAVNQNITDSKCHHQLKLPNNRLKIFRLVKC